MAGSFAFVAAAVLAFVQSLPGTRWIGVAILGLIAAAGAVREIAGFRESRHAALATREGNLRHRPVPVRDADPFALGVTRSAIAERYKGSATSPPYVPREIDPRLDRVLRHEPFVAVVGPSKAGKSRTAFEAILRNYPSRLLVAPRSPEGDRQEELSGVLAESIENAAGSGIVIWLDDLPELLKARSISTQDVNLWRDTHPDVVVVATVRDGELASLRNPSAGGTEAEKVLEQATLVPLSSSLSTQEEAAAAATYPGEDFRDGIGVHFVAGPQLVQRFVSAREANPLGFAVAAAAVDRYRAGVFDAVAMDELIELAPIYHRELRPRSDFPLEEAPAALRWAAEPVIQDIAILLKADAGYVPFDYISAFRDGEVAAGVGRAEIPDALWERLIERHSGWTLKTIGETAIVRNRTDLARKAFAKLATESDPHLAAHGTDDYGGALATSGDIDGAILQLRKAATSGYNCVVTSASYRLALALESKDPAESEVLYRKVLENPSSWVYPKAAVNLGLMLRSQTSVESTQTQEGTQFAHGNWERSEDDRHLEDEARKLFEIAVESADGEAIANGSNALGALLCSQGDLDAGERALRKGIEAGSAQAAITLAVVIFRMPGREAEAWQLIDQAEKMARPEHAGYLNFSAGAIAAARGDHQEAAARFKLVAEEEAEGLAVEAAFRAAKLLLVEVDAGEEDGLALLDQIAAGGGPRAAEAVALKDRYLAAVEGLTDGGEVGGSKE